MDPFTHALLGGAVVTSLQRHPTRRGFLQGAVAGTAADLDIFIKSSQDPLLFLEYHRHFTHSLSFVPIGALLLTLLFLCFEPQRGKWREVFGLTLLAYLSHPLLDACTSYGTHLLWPWSSGRAAWDVIAIIDLGFTLPLAVGAIGVLRTKIGAWARWGLALAASYLAFTTWQHERALGAQEQLAQNRGHISNQRSVRPTLLNPILFRSIYAFDGQFFVDAIRVGWGEPQVYPGSAIKKFGESDVAQLADPRFRHDVERFRLFTSDHLSALGSDPLILGDARYSDLPNSSTSIWMIEPPQTPGLGVSYRMARRLDKERLKTFWTMILGRPVVAQPQSTVR